jgi:hypothetical protein
MKTYKKLKQEITEATKWKPGDGRPRNGSHIENVRFWDLPDSSLKYIMKDAHDAMKANPKGRKAGKYADEVNDAGTVMYWRKKNKIVVKDKEGFQRHQEEVELEEGVNVSDLSPMAQFKLINDFLSIRMPSGVKPFEKDPERAAKIIKMKKLSDKDVKDALSKMKKEKWFKEDADLNEGEKLVGWIAIFQGKKLEIKLDKDADSLYGAKKFAIKHFKVPKSKMGLLSIEPGYE